MKRIFKELICERWHGGHEWFHSSGMYCDGIEIMKRYRCRRCNRSKVVYKA